MFYCKRDDVLMKVFESTLTVYVPSLGTYEFVKLTQKEIDTVSKINKKCVDLEGVIDNKNSVFYYLKENNLIYKSYKPVKDYTNRTQKWFSYISNKPEEKYSQYRKIKVCILGLGGLGSIIFQNLIQSGINEFIIIDNGIIDLPDMNRQSIYRKKDIGKYKVDICLKYAKDNYPDIHISIHKIFINKNTTISLTNILDKESLDFIISCVDKPNFSVHSLITKAALKNSAPLIFGSVGTFDGLIGPLLKNQNEKQAYIMFVNKEVTKLKNIDLGIISGSISFTNSIIANLMSLAFFQYCTQKIKFCKSYEIVSYNFQTNQYDNYIFNKKST